MSVENIPTATAPRVWRLSVTLVCAAIAVGLLSLWPFWDGLELMWGGWLYSPEYSHGLLLPPVAGFLIWQQKDRLERMDFPGSWAGVVLVLLGGVALTMGQFGTVYTLVQYGFVITLYGLVLAFLGWKAFRLVAMPMLILLFMVPLPQFLLANLSTRLQLMSSWLGVAFMRLFDVSVFLEGNVIDLGGYKLQVAEACSGLRYLFPLMTLGLLIAYFYKGMLWKRILIFLTSIPITVLMNSARVGLIGITVERWGIGMAEGFLHEFQGWVIFMLSTLLMLGEVAVLNRLGRESGTWRQLFGVEFPHPTPRDAIVRRRTVPASFVVAALVLCAIAAVSALLPRPEEIVPPRHSFVEYPMQLGGWRGRRNSLEGIYSDALKLDDYLLADYVDQSGRAVNLYIAYYDSQRKGEAVHSPRSCLPGDGWQIREFDQRAIEVNGHSLRVNRAVVEFGNERELVYYWFRQRGRTITNEFAVKWYLFWDALRLHRTDGAMVRLITLLPPTASEAEADRYLTQFAARIAPDLPRYVPD